MNQPKKTLVRSEDKTVFEIDPITLEPMRSPTLYDPYCFDNPNPEVIYMSFAEWCREHNRKLFIKHFGG